MHLGLDGAAGITLYLGAIVAFFLSVYRNPIAGLYYLTPLLPLQTLRYRMHPFPLGGLIVDVTLLGVIIGLRRRGLPIFPETRFNRILRAYFIFTYLSLWAGAVYLDCNLPIWFNDGRLSDWKNYMVMFLLLFTIASAVRTTRQMQIILALMCFGVLMLDKDYLSLQLQRDFSHFTYDVRGAGLMGYAGVNGLAAFEAQFSAFLLAACTVIKKWYMKGAALGVLAANVLCIVYALSRGGYAAFVAAWLFIGIVKKRTLLILFFVFLSTWQSIVPPAVQERIFMTDAEEGMDHSAAVRLDLWDEALRVFKLNPVVGVGFNTYASRENVGGYTDTHNLYVKILVETGFVGLTLFVFLLAKLIKAGFHLYRTADDPLFKAVGFGFGTMILAAMVANFFGDRWTYLQVSGYTWVLLGLVVRAQEMTDRASAAGVASEGTDMSTTEEVGATGVFA